MRSCSSLVLVQETAEQVTPVHLRWMILGDGRGVPEVGRLDPRYTTSRDPAKLDGTGRGSHLERSANDARERSSSDTTSPRPNVGWDRFLGKTRERSVLR